MMIKNSRILWIATMALAVPFSAHAQGVQPSRPHAGTHVYVASNENGPNSIFVLKRNASGGLDQDQVVSTGGVGTGVGIASRHDPLGSQNSLLLSEDGKWLFAVNAGSNQISVLAVSAGRLTLVDVVPSGGVYPVSVAQRGNRLYVLNIGGEEANIVGFDIAFSGKLQIVSNSTRGLGMKVPNAGSQPNVLFAPTQLQFTPDGRWLVVVSKNMRSVGSIQLFASDQFGNLATRAVTTNANNPLAFGFAFDRGGHLLVTEGSGGAVSSYAIKENGTLQPISLSVANYQAGNCWIEIVDDLAYTSNTTANTLSAYTISPRGELQLLRGSETLVNGGRNFLPLDITLSGDDGRYLDEVNPAEGSVGSFLRAKDGSLTFVGSITLGEPFSGFSGLATD